VPALGYSRNKGREQPRKQARLLSKKIEVVIDIAPAAAHVLEDAPHRAQDVRLAVRGQEEQA